ncbi:MAG: hypothetical protein E7116_01215 [Bacteroidales bacterium]|nr:hypothetical protein [Bacteroidales bacterium]
MKTNHNFPLMYALLLICQVILCNYAHLGPYITLTFLPAMILCVPIRISTITCMLVAFASGFLTDFLAEGLLGLNVAALLPVALIRKGTVRIFLGEDIIARKDSFSIKKNGLLKVSTALLVSTAVFLAAYIFLDGAGTRPFWFCAAKFGISLVCNWILGILVINTLTTDDRK